VLQTEISDVVESKVKNLTTWQYRATDVIDLLQSDQKKASMLLQTTNKTVEATSSKMNGLDAGLSRTNDAVCKLGQRVDLAHQYLEGAGKGLRDTHKRVAAGEDGMLAPKHCSPTLLPFAALARSISPCTPRSD